MNQELRLTQLLSKLKEIERSTVSLQNQIDEIRFEIKTIQDKKSSDSNFFTSSSNTSSEKPPLTETHQKAEKASFESEYYHIDSEIPHENFGEVNSPSSSEESHTPSSDSNWENFIGGNLLSKLGILILILGLGVLVKYAIDQNLLSPVTRVVLAYVGGGILLGVSYYLRATYKSYSAALFSGGIATFYFTTYIAQNVLELMPLPLAFVLMLLCTAFTVYESTRYQEEVIGMVGLIGAYAVPILLSSGGGNIAIFYSYLALINLIILWLAFKQSWSRTIYLAFGLTWLALLGGLASSIDSFDWEVLAFGGLFFIIFQVAFSLVILKKLNEEIAFICLIINTVIYYLIGVAEFTSLSEENIIRNALFFFTLGLALYHGGAAFWFSKQDNSISKLISLNLNLSIIGLVVAVPMRFDGTPLVIGWLLEALILFAIGRLRSLPTAEKFSIGILGLSLFTLIRYWGMEYVAPFGEFNELFLWNQNFLTSFLFITGLSIWAYLDELFPTKDRQEEGVFSYVPILQHLDIVLVSLIFLVGYFGILLEFSARMPLASSLVDANQEIYTRTSLYIFTGFYVGVCLLLNYLWIKKSKITDFLILSQVIFGVLLTLFSLENGLISEVIYLPLRFLLYASLVFSCVLAYYTSQKDWVKKSQRYLIIYFHVLSIAWISFELVDGFLVQGSANPELRREIIQRLWLTLFWALYSLILIAYGIAQKRKYLRLTGFALFGLTILKLFTLDLSYNSPINVILALIGVGVLLLITAFLYQKFKDVILADDEE
jgi:uncharacterized membrane protein